MSGTIELNGYVEKDGTIQPFYLRISEPRRSADAEDFSCLIHAPMLFNADKTIFGADAAQARSLAVQFVQSMLDSRTITDGAGNPIELRNL